MEYMINKCELLYYQFTKCSLNKFHMPDTVSTFGVYSHQQTSLSNVNLSLLASSRGYLKKITCMYSYTFTLICVCTEYPVNAVYTFYIKMYGNSN